MAVAFDSATAEDGTGTSQNVTHTCTGSDRVLYGIIMSDDTTDHTPSATYNSVAMTQIAEVAYDGGANGSQYVVVFRLIAPATGANTLAFSGMTGAANKAWVAFSVTGAHQTTPEGTIQTVGNQPATTSSSLAVDVGTDGLAFDAISVNGGSTDASMVLGADQTEPADGKGNGTGMAARTSYETGSGTKTLSWSWTGSQGRSHIAIPVLAAAAAAAHAGSLVNGIRLRTNIGGALA